MEKGMKKETRCTCGGSRPCRIRAAVARGGTFPLPGEVEMSIAPGTGGPVGVIGAGLKRAGRKLRRTNIVLLILILTVSSLVPLALDGNGNKMSGAIINSDPLPVINSDGPAERSSEPPTSADQTPEPSEPTSTPDSNSPPSGSTEATETPPKGGTPVPNLSGGGSIATGALSSNMTVETNGGAYAVIAERYKIVIAQSGNSVSYTIRPYFSSDVIRYGRLNPLTGNEGTVDEYGNLLNHVTTTITSWGQDGNKVWFVESCSQYSLRHKFTIYRDYFDLDVTYTPGASKVIATYAISMNSASGSYYDLFSDGQDHRYIPGTPLDLPKSNGIGGWYPFYRMFAPAFDMRVPGRQLGVEWGFSDEEAYIWSPTWIAGNPVDGASVFSVKYTSTGGVLPDPALGTEQTFHMFVGLTSTPTAKRGLLLRLRRVDRTAVQPSGPLALPVPLSFYDFGGNSGTWPSDFRGFINSPILAAQLSNNPDQVNWHYKSAQRLDDGDNRVMPTGGLYDSPGHSFILPDGDVMGTASSAAFRNYLIYQDMSNSGGGPARRLLGRDQLLVRAQQPARSDYNHRSGYIWRVHETGGGDRGSGKFSFVITNPYTPVIHLAMVSDLACSRATSRYRTTATT